MLKVKKEPPIGSVLWEEFVYGQFARKFLDKNYSEHQMPEHWSKKTKKLIKLHGDLMGKFFRIARLLPESSFVGAVVKGVCQEQNLLLLGNTQKSQDDNYSLQSLENPFSKHLEVYTYAFIEYCHEKARRSNDFNQEYQDFVFVRIRLIEKVGEWIGEVENE